MGFRIQKLLTPPSFADDADKTQTASVLHRLLIAAAVFFIILEGIVVRLDFAERMYFTLGIPGLVIAIAIAYGLMQRGRVRFASAFFIVTLWVAFTLFLPFAGGMRSVVVVFYVAGAVITGLLLGIRAALVHIMACGVVGLGMVFLANGAHKPPLLFVIPHSIGWMGMMLSLALTIGALALVGQRRDAALASLRESEERYRQLFEAESDAIFLIDNASGQILEANDAAVALYGYSRAELLIKRNTDLSAEPEDTRKVTQTTPVVTEQVIIIPLRFHRKCDGTVFPVEITGRFFNWKGRPVHIAAIRDITARQQTEMALHQKTEELDRYFTLSLDLLCIADTAGHFVRLNPEWEKTLGYPLDDLEGRRFLDLVHPDDVEVTLAALATLERQQHVLNFENRYRCKDGSYRCLEWRASSQGKFIYAAARDITDRKQAEQALAESEARYRSLFEDNHAVMLIYERQEGRILDANPAACTYYGWSRNEMMTKYLRDIDPLTPEEVTREIEAVRREGRGYYLFKHRRADGAIRDVEVYSGPIQMQGQSVHYAIVHDVTERRLAEEVLQRSEALYRRAIEVIGAVPYEYAPNAYVFMGEGIRALTGYAPEEMTPELWLSLVQKSIMLDKASGMERDDAIRLARSGQLDVWKSDDYIRARDGQMRWVMDAAVEIPDENGISRASIGILLDITERKQAEEALRESNRRLVETLAELRETQERMMQQERLAAVGQLAAGIAHDFNNILASIVLYTQMSLRTELPPPVRQRLEIIAQQTDRAADLVQQILDFGRRAVLERQPLMLDSFLKEVVKLLQRTLPENIQIDLTLDAGAHLILADPTRIQQVVVNLALNARDAMPNGGKLHIALARIAGQTIHCVDCGPVFGGEWVEIAVADTGTGIPPEVLPHIFEPFFTTRAPLGHGLGLAQVYGLVNQHDGHLAIETQVGVGTTFRLYWPVLHTPQPQPLTSSAAEIVRGHGETLLVVEDDAVVRAALVDALDVLGYRVLQAANGQEALALYKAHADAIALVLSDWVMPAMGGLELVSALQALNPTLKVLMLTGHPLSQETRESVSTNVVGWTLKPPSLDQLARDLRKALA
ncbi:MAG TPA: PAS domain S-box protein [Anaerolineae bacterium]|nr:PAS domain S-box protein [Anaerolineae bacterium]HQI86934.1 PAS domain S-box protein [Anaerolineae bacterium]